ncbi:MAG: ABC-F family ATP-binding cassette domain-containing protein [Nitrospirota bacterium]
MIQVSNLSKSYGTQVIFDDVGFTVNAGERIGLMGRNGSGKTTLLRIITGEEKPDAGVIGIPNNYAIGHLAQHLHFIQESVLREACLGLKTSDDGRDESYKAEKILMGLGFTEKDFSRHPLDLSGGFQVRLHLAKLFTSEPDLLLLDEPTNYLDIISIRWLTRFLKGWKGELILITHDREFMDGVTTHTLCIHRNKIRKIAGPTQKLSNQILREEEVYELTRVNEEKKRLEVEQFITRFRAQATRARLVQSKIKALQRKEKLEKMSGIKDLEFEFAHAPFRGKILLEARDISFSFDPEGPLLIDGLDLSLGKRDRIGVIGKNGKGKTTFLNLLAGELQPFTGELLRHEQAQIAYFGQTNIQRLDSEKTVEEEILDAMPEYHRSAARTICGIMMFEGDTALKKIKVLSGGERSRVLLGRLIVSPANLLLLDEPTNHLDMESVDSLLTAIEAFEGAVVIVTHSEMILNAVATRLVVFDDNTVKVFEGTYQDFLQRKGWSDEEDEAGSRDSLQKRISAKRKDFKRTKAELINARSRTLGPLQARITETEEQIVLLEQQIEEDTQALVDASQKGDGEAIKQLSISLRDAKEKIDALFDELEKLTDEFDAKTREFEGRLGTIKVSDS